MVLPQHLSQSIERTNVAFEGLSHPLRIVAVDPDPPPPQEPTAAKITVETAHNGATHRATCVIPLSELGDERHVATTLAECMRGVLAGG
ncbi:MAG TPA: hypothetical protein VM364_13325 [Vicinamibacterales bacterium]|nr:hypothetical protein [Vicinamibacterales bacterium]